MKAPALVAVFDPPSRFDPLFAAARSRRVRFGWLELAPPPPLDGPLEDAAAHGALRAVSAGAGRTVACKPLRGEPVLRDLLREHFLGCELVFVRGFEGRPRLSATPRGYRLELVDAGALEVDADRAIRELLRPRYRS